MGYARKPPVTPTSMQYDSSRRRLAVILSFFCQRLDVWGTRYLKLVYTQRAAIFLLCQPEIVLEELLEAGFDAETP